MSELLRRVGKNANRLTVRLVPSSNFLKFQRMILFLGSMDLDSTPSFLKIRQAVILLPALGDSFKSVHYLSPGMILLVEVPAHDNYNFP